MPASTRIWYVAAMPCRAYAGWAYIPQSVAAKDPGSASTKGIQGKTGDNATASSSTPPIARRAFPFGPIPRGIGRQRRSPQRVVERLGPRRARDGGYLT